MKTLTKVTSTALLSVACFIPMISNAMPTTAVKFDKGSYCGTYSGDLSKGRKFTVVLGADQEFTVWSSSAYINSIRDSQGKFLQDEGVNATSQYVTLNKGKHTIRMGGSGYSEVEFCAY